MAQVIRIFVINLLWTSLACWAIVATFGWPVLAMLLAWAAVEAVLIYRPALRALRELNQETHHG